jgi:xeroderma pigmentosum group C-complementing protein
MKAGSAAAAAADPEEDPAAAAAGASAAAAAAAGDQAGDKEGSGAVDSNMQQLYGLWQTDAFVRRAVDGKVPRNQRGNVEVPPLAKSLPEGEKCGPPCHYQLYCITM